MTRRTETEAESVIKQLREAGYSPAEQQRVAQSINEADEGRYVSHEERLARRQTMTEQCRLDEKRADATVIKVDFGVERISDFVTSSGKKVELPPTAQIDNFGLECKEFMSVILDRPPAYAACVNDETTLLDLRLLDEDPATWLQSIREKVDAHYGVGATPHLAGPIWQVFADIRDYRRQNFLRQK